ncbi:alpha-D-ribose 1-methylphosphonate 5-triphosphate diphosphatase [Halorubrum sp. Ib24]|uniref:alpha-D-ribose 1-methylphosphonate 5-triphosphate diphosphatase n=1 Tax=Halorubrum sp. Ib24 TaxID=1383850 RepID=UPI000B983514|nr:alpha-D-ribose 1-methylphosphonate 5-triphosphate diphosphatase [Halorubrum sp. Ib24]OYR41856.1 alpha-D-ribose 1-methylphosphonate 5-triphosphate diphosphatase [Halorubrum sp. Ib24]
MTDPVEIRNGSIVTPHGVIEGGRVVLADRRVAEVGDAGTEPIPEATTVDADGNVVMPGLVDLHGDDVEDELYPRSGARVDAREAVIAADRRNAAAGITTKFHAIAFEETPSEDRSIADATDLVGAIAGAEETLCDNRIHARCELSEESVGAVESLLEAVPVDLVSVMHHSPDGGQFDDEEFSDHYVEQRDCTRESAATLAVRRRNTSTRQRIEFIGRVAALARDRGVPLASHDDDSPEAVDRMAAMGASISEFPVTLEAAARATSEHGVATTMGAPNLVRGGSLWGNLNAREAVDAGVVDALCTDYHPQSLLKAAFVDTGEPLATRVARVTVNPAEAVGLYDRGRLRRGARADVLVVDPDPTPTVERVYVGGREAVRTTRPDDARERVPTA